MPPVDLTESYYLETREGLFFAVKGMEHPPDRTIAVVRYVPDPVGGERIKDGVSYRRLYHFPEQEKLLQSSFPQYLAYDPVFQAVLQSVPDSAVRRIYDPRLRLEELFQTQTTDPIEADAIAFADLLQAEAGIPPMALGVSGSLLIGLHTNASDLDISVFGMEASRRVYDALGRLLHSRSASGLLPLDMAGVEELYRQRVVDTYMSFDDFAKLEINKVFQGGFRNRPYFIRFIKKTQEVGIRYGDMRYAPIGHATLMATVTDDREAIFTPCRYAISNLKILEGPNVEIDEIVSFRGRFCEQSRTGDCVHASGTVERIEETYGGIRHRLLLGNSPADTMVVRR